MKPFVLPGQGPVAIWGGDRGDFPALSHAGDDIGRSAAASSGPIQTVFIASGDDATGKAHLERALSDGVAFVVLGKRWTEPLSPRTVRRIGTAGVRIVGPGSAGVITPFLSGNAVGNTALLAERYDAFLHVLSMARRSGIPFRYALSFGEGRDYTFLEAAQSIFEHDPAVDLYIFVVETLREGRALLDFAEVAARQGKRTALLQLSRTEGEQVEEDALFRQYDVVVLGEPSDIVDGAAVFLHSPRPQGKKVHCLSPSRELDGLLRREAAALGFECCGDREAADILLEIGASCPVRAKSGQAHVRTTVEQCPDGMARSTSCPPLVPGIGRSVRAMQLAAFPRRTTNEELRRPYRTMICPVHRRMERDAKIYLATYDIPIAKERLCRSYPAALIAAEEIGYPVALKVLSPSILYKTEARVIALNLHDEEELRNAYGRTLEKARLADPKADIRGVLVQEMVYGGTEWRMEFHRDPRFGPIVGVGISGAYREFLPDWVIRGAPFDEEEALEMIRESKGYPLLLKGWNRPALDVDGFAVALSSFSRLAYCEKDVARIEVHPLFVTSSGVLVVDAFIEAEARRKK